MAETRDADLVMAPNEFAFISDFNTGLIKPIVGPTKKTLDSTEQPVVLVNGQFQRCEPRRAIQLFSVVDESSYLVLGNPVAETDKEHPRKGQDNPMPILLTGQKKNIPGPATFPLWPGQTATVIEGHQLRSNQYLRCVVHNAKEAMLNWSEAVVDKTSTDGGDKASGEVTKQSIKLVTGQILIIKGTEVSYYIPPTGVNVIPEDGSKYVRDAVTLERLEYCILLDESGDKRYLKGPDVVFPEPTETFVTKKGDRKFRAIELNENMGLYIKVIANYTEGNRDNITFEAGEELFITGKEQKIYYPRDEHDFITYDGQEKHYAVAIPKGEARYVLSKDTGEIATVPGPKMYMPDPRKEVIVRRVLSDKEVHLWFPNNDNALVYNRELRKTMDNSREPFSRTVSRRLSNTDFDYEETGKLAESFVTKGMPRSSTYTKPRSITLNSKYDGAVNINVWPGYAVQVVSKTGKRKVVIGPESVILEYDESLEVMELSTGKPKTDNKMINTVYLQVKNNRISDIVEADTKDMVHVQVGLNYRVNFESELKEDWFSVENYVKFLTQNLRSIIRNEVQKHGIEDVAQNVAPIFRDVILGKSPEEGDRPGHPFPENGMRVYDVEILSLSIGDNIIRKELQDAQHTTVRYALQVAAKKQQLGTTQAIEKCEQEMASARSETNLAKMELVKEEQTKKSEVDEAAKEIEQRITELIDKISDIRRNSKVKDENADVVIAKDRLEMQVVAFERQFGAISSDLIAAIQSTGQTKLAEAFVKNIPQAGQGVGMVLGQQLITNLIGLVKGTPAEKALHTLVSNGSSGN